MTALITWLSLDGYGQYVWPSYALTLVAVVLNVRWARRSVVSARETARRRITTMRAQT